MRPAIMPRAINGLLSFASSIATGMWNTMVAPIMELITKPEKSADLLAQTGLSVGEIASRTGFNQQSYFGKRFKEKTRMTPLEYRKRTGT